MNLRPIRVLGSDPVDHGWARLYEQAHHRLLARIEEYGVPTLEAIPVQDLVVLYRLPTKQKEKVTRGGIIIPDAYQREQIPFSVGLLLAAGPQAQDVLESHGVLPGDLVMFAPLAGDEVDAAAVVAAQREAARRGGDLEQIEEAGRVARDGELEKKKLLTLQAPFIHRSVDLLQRLYGPTPTMERVRESSPKGFKHLIRPII